MSKSKNTPPPVRVYLAGPMRGRPEFNFPAFSMATETLRREFGWEVFNPAERDIAAGFDPTGMTGDEDLSELGFSLREALAADTAYIATYADAVIVLPGWEESAGVKAEEALARALNLPVVAYDDALTVARLGYGNHRYDFKRYDVDRFVTAAPVQTIGGLTNITFSEPEGGPEAYIIPTGGDSRKLADEVLKKMKATLGEVRTTSSTGGQKGVKPERYGLVPWTSIAAIARHFNAGAAKYADHQWRQGYEWSKSFDALLRHLFAWWEGEDIDAELTETAGYPVYHIDAVGWHFCVLRFLIDNYPQHDNRPPHPERTEEP